MQEIFIYPHFLTDAECDRYIQEIDQKTNKTHFTAMGDFENDKYIDPKLTNYFYQKLLQHLGDHQLNITRPNKLIMSGKYYPGQSFCLHTDTGLYFDQEEETRWTLLIYLNDNYQGGETSFYDDNFQHTRDVIPRRGQALLFNIDLWHKGNEVRDGTKYWIGCEIIGRRGFV